MTNIVHIRAVTLSAIVALVCICVGPVASATLPAREAGVATAVDMPAGDNAAETTYEDVRVLSLWLCRTDRECARRFFIDRRAFDRRLFYYLFDRFVAETAMKHYLQHNMFDDRVKETWVRMMRTASFCTENELPTADGYCVCRNGKVCHEAAADAFSLDVVSFNFLAVLGVAGLVYYSALHLARFRDMYENVLRLSRADAEDRQARRAGLAVGPRPADLPAEPTTYLQHYEESRKRQQQQSPGPVRRPGPADGAAAADLGV